MVTDRLLAALPPRVKVTMVTAPWRPVVASHRPGNSGGRVLHCPSAYSDDPAYVFSLCRHQVPLDVGLAVDLPPCVECRQVLRVHHLWPLGSAINR